MPKEDPFEWIFNEFYNQNNINLDQNLIANVEKRELITLEMNLEEIHSTSESSVEIFCFLFRRSKSNELYNS